MEHYVNTKTQEEYNELMDILEKQGNMWIDGNNMKDVNEWYNEEENSVIEINKYIYYADKDYYTGLGKKNNLSRRIQKTTRSKFGNSENS